MTTDPISTLECGIIIQRLADTGKWMAQRRRAHIRMDQALMGTIYWRVVIAGTVYSGTSGNVQTAVAEINRVIERRPPLRAEPAAARLPYKGV